jgi:hypothetical protein
LATGVSGFPEGYTTGQSVPFTLHIYDQYGEPTLGQGNLFVQRAAKLERVTEAKCQDLFGNPRLRGAPTQVIIQQAGAKQVSVPGASGYLCTDAAKEDEVCGQ